MYFCATNSTFSAYFFQQGLHNSMNVNTLHALSVLKVFFLKYFNEKER